MAVCFETGRCALHLFPTKCCPSPADSWGRSPTSKCIQKKCFCGVMTLTKSKNIHTTFFYTITQYEPVSKTPPLAWRNRTIDFSVVPDCKMTLEILKIRHVHRGKHRIRAREMLGLTKTCGITEGARRHYGGNYKDSLTDRHSMAFIQMNTETPSARLIPATWSEPLKLFENAAQSGRISSAARSAGTRQNARRDSMFWTVKSRALMRSWSHAAVRTRRRSNRWMWSVNNDSNDDYDLRQERQTHIPSRQTWLSNRGLSTALQAHLCHVKKKSIIRHFNFTFLVLQIGLRTV